MCRDSKCYPSPNKTKSIYVKPVPIVKEKLTKTDDEISQIVAEISTDALKSTLLKLSSFHTRHSKSKEINKASDWLKNEFKNLGYDDVDFHYYAENIEGDNYDLRNVICKKNGINSKCILICAHYDSRIKNLSDSVSLSPGANDNASGVSAVLEIARILNKKEVGYTLLFALFSGEEQGLLGSKNYAKFVKENDIGIFRLINLDMIGYPQLNPGIVIIERDNHTNPDHNQVRDNDQASIEFGKIMADMSTYTDLEVSLDSIWNSDYEPFEAEGCVVIGAYDGSADEHKNPHYHDTTDTPSLIDWDYLTSVTKMTLATVYKIAKKQ